MNETKGKINKPIYFGLSISELSKAITCNIWCGFIKLKCYDKVNLCYTKIDSFIVNIKTEELYKDIALDVEKRFDT